VRETHGVPDARKVQAGDGEAQQLLVIDGARGMVRLSLGACSYPADLTPEQARFIASALLASADRVEAGGAGG